MKNTSDLDDTFLTISKPVEGLFKEKNSKFYYFAFHVKTEDAIKEELGRLRKIYFDARHHCFAWILGSKGEHHRSFDDGEPNHSAGDPILGQIRSKNLTQILVVVVRYFGGTKLGMGGLIQAYKTSAFTALENAEIIEAQVKIKFLVQFPYLSMNEVMRLVKNLDLDILYQKLEMDCIMELELREGIRDAVVLGLGEVKDLIFLNP